MIDSHAHLSLGKIYAAFGEDKLLMAMESAGIHYGVVSLLDVMEYGHQHQSDPLPTLSEWEGARMISKQCTSSRLFPLVWARPHDEKKEDFFEWLAENHQKFYGFKFHPFHSRTPLDHSVWEPYFRFAAKYGWPVVVHTAADEFSRPELVKSWIEKYPQVSFVLIHMGLYTDHEEAVKMVANYPNVFGDTTWVLEEKIWSILERCGAEKILFGSDALVGGEDTYAFYQGFLSRLQEFPELFSLITHENAKKIFHLPC
ncbi:amidohydrolase family protein [Thermospira aquatica]|uniref:Amidohydrolase family protein n=1 Tax=Thermospira aquatica TaxID=2828656 RepID=A0AAX3BFD6_9SPIR|nr:amidohydrolase family protein [Thermospira aquatica]URA11062.1 amidohydrolase family protein [Thermospira aquatica]